MTKAVAVYQSEGETHHLQVALATTGIIYEREYKRHNRFGKGLSPWRESDMKRFIEHGFQSFRRVDKEIRVVLP